MRSGRPSNRGSPNRGFPRLRIPPTADSSLALRRRRAPPRPARRRPGHVLRDEKRLHQRHSPGRREAAFCAVPRKARASRGSDEAANPSRVLFRVYLDLETGPVRLSGTAHLGDTASIPRWRVRPTPPCRPLQLLRPARRPVRWHPPPARSAYGAGRPGC